MGKNIVICLDGTGNQFKEDNSNIVKLFRSILRNKVNKTPILRRAKHSYLFSQSSPSNRVQMWSGKLNTLFYRWLVIRERNFRVTDVRGTQRDIDRKEDGRGVIRGSRSYSFLSPAHADNPTSHKPVWVDKPFRPCLWNGSRNVGWGITSVWFRCSIAPG